MAAGPPIRIRVGAAMDSSVDRVFASIEARAKRMSGVVASAFKGTGKDFKVGADEAASAWGKATERMRRNTQAVRDESFKAFREIGRVAERELNRAAAAQHRAEQRAGMRFAERTSHRATRFLMPNAPLGSYAARAAGDIARGVGVDVNIGSSIARNVERESIATKIANSGFIEGDNGPNGKRVAPALIQAKAGALGKQYGIDPTEVLGGIDAFTKRTGDLDSALNVVGNVTRLAAATGTDVDKLMQAAGATLPNLKGVENKAEVLDEVLRNLIAQGKIGAIEMEDFAKEISKLAPQANRFEGSSAKNLGQLGALAQLAFESGGATSAQQASTSVARLVDTLSTPARAKGFKKLGIDVETTNEKGMKVLRDPVSVIKQALLKTNGDPIELKKLFASSIGARPTEALAGYYRDAGGGQKGIDAVVARLEQFAGGKFSNENINKNIADRDKTTAAKVAKFQAAFDEVVNESQARLLPALERLGPAVLEAADALGRFTTWVVENPKQAIALAITASIARAGLESALRSGIERVILGVGSGGNTAQVSRVGQVAGVLGAGATIASLAITTLVVGKAIIDQLFDESQKKQKANVEGDIAATNLEADLRSGKFTPEEAKKRAQELVDKRKGNLAAEKEENTGWGRAAGDFLVGDLLGIFSKDARESVESRRKVEEERLDRAAKAAGEALDVQRNLFALLQSGIKVTNMPPDGSGRESQQ